MAALVTEMLAVGKAVVSHAAHSVTWRLAWLWESVGVVTRVGWGGCYSWLGCEAVCGLSVASVDTCQLLLKRLLRVC